MKTLLQAISYVGLTITVAAPLLLWAGRITVDANRALLIAGMFLWFGSAIFWIKHDPSAND